MATQTVDFSNIETVVKDGQNLTRIQLDGVTVWESSHVGLLWQQLGQQLDGSEADTIRGYSVAIRGDGLRVAVLDNRNDIYYYDYNGSIWVIGDSWIGNEGETRSNLNYVGDDLYFLSRYKHEIYGTDITRFTVHRSGGQVSKEYNAAYDYLAVSSGDRVYITGNNGLRKMVTVGSSSITTKNKEDEAPGSGNNPRVALSSTLDVVYGNQAAVRNGNNRAGEVQVYDAYGNQKGQFIVGESANTELGKYVKISDDGNRIAVAARSHIRLYDYDGSVWVRNTSNIACTLGGGRIPYALEASADLSRIACVFSNSGGSGIDKTVVEVFEYNGSSVGLIGRTISPLPFDTLSTNPSLSLSPDGNHLIVGDYQDDSSGDNAGSAVVYSLSAL